MRQGRQSRGWPSLSAGIRATALIVCLGIPSFVATSLYQHYWQDLHAAEVNTANTTRALEAHVARTIETLDTYLQTVISLIGSRTESISPEGIHKALRDRLDKSDHLTNILILGEDGDVLHEAGAFPARSLDRSKHDYFERLRDHPDAGLVVGLPSIGRFTNLPILPIARRINHADGSFAGVIVATLRPTVFQSVFDDFDLGPGSTTALWRSDGTLLVRTPHVPALIGRNFSAMSNYQRHVVPRDSKPFWAVGSTDGVERVLALGFIPSYPLYVSATQSRETALREWRTQVWTQGCVAGGLTLVLVVALLALAREIRRRQIVDVQLREAERNARDSTRLLQTTLDNMEQGLIEIDPDGIVQVCNRRARDLLGLPDGLIASRPPFGKVLEWQLGDGEAESAGLECERFWQDGTIVGTMPAFERECRNGRVLEVRTVALPHGGAVRTYTDITQRRRGEQAFKESEARYRLLAEAATDMIVLTDLDGVRRYISPACRDLLGHEPEELVGTRVVTMVHPDDTGPLAEVFAGLRTGSAEQASSINRLRRKDGSYVWVEAKLKLIRQDASGAPSGIICTVRDISDRQKKAEELGLAKEAAEAGARAKSEFLVSMSHELRTPLNSIIGFSGLMVESGAMALPTMQRYARLVQAASMTLLSIVNDVLDVSKMEAGSFELDPHPFSPRDLIEGAASLLRSQADEKGLALYAEAEPTVPGILVGDDARLRQVLLNLLSNAVKFTAKGMVWLFVDCEADADGMARIRFTVSDTGIGIPADKRHRLFQRFSQVDGSTARQFGGTGLGLSICKSLVEIMGGSIEVESTEGEGSSFSFVLDLPVGTAAAGPGSDVPVPAEGAYEGAHILLAEDVAMNRELALALLTQWNHTVDVVPDGAAAVDAVMRTRYDLVLMDIQMPVMDGLEATRRIRQLGGAHATLPIVAMTANVMARDVERSRTAGADDHIGKPFVPDKLRAIVAHWAAKAGPGPVEGIVRASTNPICNAATLDELRAMLGADSLAAMLRNFSTDLDVRLREGPDGHQAWQAILFDAHAIVSSAGMLGFDHLSQECQSLEEICAAPSFADQDAHEQLRKVRHEIDAIKRIIPQMVTIEAHPRRAGADVN